MASDTEESPFTPIVYFEDPSYARIPDEYTRTIGRQWRYKLERVLGLYNAKLDHVCTEACLEPILLPKEDTGTEEEEEDDDADGESMTRVSTLMAGVIDMRHSLFGCPRSGIFHWCAPSMALRASSDGGGCLFRSINRENRDIVCGFSGRVVLPADPEYDRFKDTTIDPYQRVDVGESRYERAARIAQGLNKHMEMPIVHSKEKQDENNRMTIERKSIGRVVRNLERQYERSVEAHHVVPSLDRSPRKVSVTRDPTTTVTSSSTTTNGKRTTSMSGAASRKKTKFFEVGFQLRISMETQAHIKNIIIDLLCDADMRADLYPTSDVNALPANDPYILYCIRRVARVYALVSEEHDMDRARVHASVDPTTRNIRVGACISMNVKNITITTLYTYAKGMNLSNQGNLIPIDERLALLLPKTRDLMWCGMKALDRQYLRQNGQWSTQLPRQKRKYDSAMATNAVVQLQQTFTNTRYDVLSLRQILNDD